MKTTGGVQGHEAPGDVPDDDGDDGGEVGEEDVVECQSHPRSASENDSRSH